MCKTFFHYVYIAVTVAMIVSITLFAGFFAYVYTHSMTTEEVHAAIATLAETRDRASVKLALATTALRHDQTPVKFDYDAQAYVEVPFEFDTLEVIRLQRVLLRTAWAIATANVTLAMETYALSSNDALRSVHQATSRSRWW